MPAPDETEDVSNLIEVHQCLLDLMRHKKPYLINDLSLTQLAGWLNINPRLLSRVINQKAGCHFHDFINRYRVTEFRERLKSAEKDIRILDLAMDCGFNSKATFNHAFKRECGCTPSHYRKQFASQQN